MILSRILKFGLKWYSIFAVLNSIYKISSYFYTIHRSKKLWKHLPGEDADPAAKKLRKNVYKFHDFLAENGLKNPHADLVKLPIPSPLLLCNTPKSIKWILKDQFKHVTKPGNSDQSFWFLRNFIGSEGIFVLSHGPTHKYEHDKWYQQRKIASRIFTKSNFMTTFYDTFVEKGRKVLKRLEKSEGEVIDIQALMFSYTMDSIEKLFFGTDVNTVEGGMSEYAKAFDDAHMAMESTLRENIPAIILAKILLPYPFGSLTSDQTSTCNNWIRQLLYSRSANYKKFKKSKQKLDEHVEKYLNQTRVDPNISDRKDIIGNFLNSTLGKEISNKQLKDIVLNLTLAGRDTTACALSWLIFELTQNLDVQEKLWKEIQALEGKIPTLENLQATTMPYLNGVVYEVLRLHPPVPSDPKIAEQDLVFEDGTLIPKHTKLLYSPYCLGRNPERYPNPLRFDPERWIPFKQPDLYEFPVFQAGPRFCLGKDLALFEMKMLTVMMLQKFSFTLKAGEEKKIGYSLMITMSVATNETKDKCELLVIPKSRS